ncbi:MAG: hypothetical protein K1X79_09695 [Oligoflexia bacterium]|nr:hypothetical protein [Oligoflexia bacterium]
MTNVVSVSHSREPAPVGEYHSLSLGSARLQVQERRVDIWVPPVVPPTSGLEVLFVLDGQSAFSRGPGRAAGPSWGLEDVVTARVALGLPGMLVVGVHTTGAQDRFFNFTSRDSYEVASLGSVRGGNVSNFSKWVAQELRPLIQERFPVSRDAEAAHFAGSSLAAFAVAKTAVEQGGFGHIYILSPGYFRSAPPERKEHTLLTELGGADLSNVAVHVACGTEEGIGCSDEQTEQGDAYLSGRMLDICDSLAKRSGATFITLEPDAHCDGRHSVALWHHSMRYFLASSAHPKVA